MIPEEKAILDGLLSCGPAVILCDGVGRTAQAELSGPAVRRFLERRVVLAGLRVVVVGVREIHSHLLRAGLRAPHLPPHLQGTNMLKSLNMHLRPFAVVLLSNRRCASS